MNRYLKIVWNFNDNIIVFSSPQDGELIIVSLTKTTENE